MVVYIICLSEKEGYSVSLTQCQYDYYQTETRSPSFTCNISLPALGQPWPSPGHSLCYTLVVKVSVVQFHCSHRFASLFIFHGDQRLQISQTMWLFDAKYVSKHCLKIQTQHVGMHACQGMRAQHASFSTYNKCLSKNKSFQLFSRFGNSFEIKTG